MARPVEVARIAAVAVLATVLLGGCGAARRATARTFVGHWRGHTRRLDIASGGLGREQVQLAGIARPLSIGFRVVRVHGTRDDAVARVLVTSVAGPRRTLARVRHPNLRAGDIGSLLLRHGVITDGLTEDVFCAPHVDECGS